MTDPTPEYRTSTEPRQITGLDRARAALAGKGLSVTGAKLRAAFDRAADLHKFHPEEQFIYAVGYVLVMEIGARPAEWVQAARELREREGER